MRTDTIVKTEGMSALIATLGEVDAERFIVLVNRENFDYTKWRERNLDENLPLAELSTKAEAYSKQLGM